MINFAILGCGRIAKRHAELLGTGQIAGARLAAVCDIQADRADRFGATYKVPAFHSLDELLKADGIDVVSVLTPSGMHAEHTIAVAKARKHEVVEKPMALTLDDAKEIAGAKAVWPKISVDDLDLMLQIEIAAGTTGRPNTTAQREAWAAEMPVIQGMAMQIGGLLKSSPQEIARVLEEMVKETMVRSGDDNVEIERFIPQAGQPMLLVDPQTGTPVGC